MRLTGICSVRRPTTSGPTSDSLPHRARALTLSQFFLLIVPRPHHQHVSQRSLSFSNPSAPFGLLFLLSFLPDILSFPLVPSASEVNFEDIAATRAKLQSVRLARKIARDSQRGKLRVRVSRRTTESFRIDDDCTLRRKLSPSLDIPHFAANLPSPSPLPFSRCLLFLPCFLGRLPRSRTTIPLSPLFHLTHSASLPSFAHFLSPESGALIISRHGKSTSPILRVVPWYCHTCVHTRPWTRGYGGRSFAGVSNRDTSIAQGGET